MPTPPPNLHPTHHRLIQRPQKQNLIQQNAITIWIYGPSGAGKTTIAIGLEKKLHQNHILTQLLDGDNIRTGINQDLTFTQKDRQENIRRTAEIAKLHLHIGIPTIIALITPKRQHRQTARQIIGTQDYHEIYLHCPIQTCQNRDPKGLYTKAKNQQIPHFTGPENTFEPPDPKHPPTLTLHTHQQTPQQSIQQLYQHTLPHIRPTTQTHA